MPVTPLHYPFAFAISKTNKKLSLPGLVVGSMIPDLECPFLILFFSGVLPDHLLLHSLVGALTLGVLIAVLATRFLYPTIISKIFGVDKSKLDEACRITPILVISCIIGVLSHLALDYPMHPFNPTLWPWVDPYELVGPMVIFFAFGGDIDLGFFYSRVLMHGIMIVFWILIILKYRHDNLWENIWVGSNYYDG